MRKTLLVVIAALLVGVAYSSVYTVDRAEYVYVTQFGRHVATHDGETDAGLYWKWPWPIQSVQRLDSRLQFFDLPATELLTQDPQGKSIDKTITVSAYVCWRIADRQSVDRFIRRIGTPRRAQEILGERVKNQVGAIIGSMRMDELFNVDSALVRRKMEEIRERVLSLPGLPEEGQTESRGLRDQAREAYGIDIVDVQIQRTSHPDSVRDTIYQRIRSERFAKAADYRSSGEKAAEDIRSKASAEVSDIKNKAKSEMTELQGQAEIAAANIRKLALSKDPQFYFFLKKLATATKIVSDGQTTLWVSAGHRLLDILNWDPGQKPMKPANGTGGP